MAWNGGWIKALGAAFKLNHSSTVVPFCNRQKTSSKSKWMIKDEVKHAAEDCEAPLKGKAGRAGSWAMEPPEKGSASHLVPRRLRTIYDMEPLSTRQEADKAIQAFE